MDENVLTDAENVFKLNAFKFPECGDCLIVAGLKLSGTSGLGGFLPLSTPGENRFRVGSNIFAPQIGTDSPNGMEANFGWKSVELQLQSNGFQSLRDFCVKLIHRYNYIIGKFEKFECQ